MQVFDDLESLYAQVEKEVETILNIEAEKIRKAMYDYIDNEIYNSYDEKVYERTNEFKNSATFKPAKGKNGEWSVEVYIPDTEHSPSNWRGENRTLSEIAEFFAEGHGYGRGGVKLDVIGEISKEYINEKKARDEIISYLKSKFDIIV